MTPLRLATILALTTAWALAAPPRLAVSLPAETDLGVPGVALASDTWLEMIRAAQHRLDFGQFYVANRPGTALDRILVALEEAGRRGVAIRFLLSSRMIEGDTATVARLKAIPGAEVRLLDLSGPGRGVLHAKYFLVDGRALYVGSQNFDWRAFEHIHETGVRVEAPSAVARLAAIFESDWTLAGTGRPKAWPTPPAFPAPEAGEPELLASPAHLNPPGVRAALPVLLELLGRAQSRIRIQLLTYSPISGKTRFWPDLDNALRSAAARGVTVQLLVSDWNLEAPAVDHLRSLAALPRVEVRVAAVPEAQAGHIPYARVIHSKVLRVDQEVLVVSTSNWSEGYFTESRNIELLFRDPALAAQADALSERVWAAPFTFRLESGRTYVPRARE